MPELLRPLHISSLVHDLHHTVSCILVSPGAVCSGIFILCVWGGGKGVLLVYMKLICSWSIFQQLFNVLSPGTRS